MAQDVFKPDGKPPVRHDVKLAIQCPAKRTSRCRERLVVYLRYSTPAVTAAEVEIMHQHMEQIASNEITSA